ncbi:MULTISPECIES: hypothetical protein [unclassified Undibacterium]|uniref:hypothetical protein n=1 Tax=unclassified Undibacterium TaxID=2630295 RepID=UPI002AC9B26D|nr:MULTISPECIES: hypothetical protein [unclassified Undibacterium]MEB0137958.1 hypothetical protein [Undibacterium sp. CCC2.1]MEB0173108.1 hypothetical protein [Undibacterium sp. CCC1.1]MEB0174966.1 hypothetical protein [Undibacterium sp. CCC3.4]MEB0216126.1 hypothetical protein [Undibacterium sp. 5I2]WPX45409.1 hypothetical protein RHM61_09420 [Undibacterium sp. CCC3.4]
MLLTAIIFVAGYTLGQQTAPSLTPERPLSVATSLASAAVAPSTQSAQPQQTRQTQPRRRANLLM